MNDTPKKPRGFAAISPERRREIAQKGGRAANALGRAHRWNREEALAAVAKRDEKKNALPEPDGA